MMTAEQIVDAIKRLPENERMRLKDRWFDMFKAPVGPDPAPTVSTSEETPRDADDFLALAGCINTGKVLVPFPTREQIYDENW